MKKAIAIIIGAIILGGYYAYDFVQQDRAMKDELDAMYEEQMRAYEDQFFLNDYEDVCLGMPREEAAEYPGLADISKAVIFKRANADDVYIDQFNRLPSEWEAKQDYPYDVELVICLTGQNEVLEETCEYTDDRALNNYSMEYDVKMYAALTGELVDETVLEIPAEVCPTEFTFFEFEADWYPSYAESLAEWAQSYIVN